MDRKHSFIVLHLVIALTIINVSTVSAAPPLRVTINQAATQVDPTNTSPINFTVIFTAATTDFITGDVTLSGTAGATTATVTGSGAIYNVAVSGMTSSGSVIADIAAGVAHDSSGSPNKAATYTDNIVTFNTNPPTVIFDLQAGSDSGVSNTDDLTNATSPVFDAIFSEEIIGLDSTDLSNIGSATGCIFTVGTPSSFTYPVTVSACSEGELIVRLATGAVTDTSGNPNVQTDGPTVTLDRTAPLFSSVTPVTGAFITSITTSSAVSYTLSEAIASGSISMMRTDGSADAGSPHICTLTGTALRIGAHSNLDLSDTTDACTAAQSLVIGAIYTFTFNGSDTAGNLAATVSHPGVTFEAAAPGFSAVAPASNTFINNTTTASDVSYTLSETIASGSISMTRTGGTLDTDSPHVCTLTGTALNSGVHNRLNLSDTTNACTVAQTLVSGSVYTFAFNATDKVGNPIPTVTSPGVVFDDTPPSISIGAPSVTITKGIPVTYIVTYADAYFSGSALNYFDLTLIKTGTANGSISVSGSGLMYTVAISAITGNGTLGIMINNPGTAWDLAGNYAPASSLSISFTVDTIPPSISWIAPVSDTETYIVSNELLMLAVNAVDNIAISRVVFSRWNPTTFTWIEIGRVTSSPYTLIFDTSELLPAYNEINADAFDPADNKISNYIWLYHLPILTVNKTGNGIGTVTSSPDGIDCGATCFYGFADNTVVTLTATTALPHVFGGWSGSDCSGMGTCTVTMDTDKSVTATFIVGYRHYIPVIMR